MPFERVMVLVLLGCDKGDVWAMIIDSGHMGREVSGRRLGRDGNIRVDTARYSVQFKC